MNRCPRAVSIKLYMCICFAKVSPFQTVEATKHPKGLAQIILSVTPLNTEVTKQPAK